jgi:hypothetical protein
MNILPKTTLDVMANIAILGAIVVSLGYPFIANVLWMISNPYMLYHNRKINQPEQAKMFLVYTLISLFGIYNLWPK